MRLHALEGLLGELKQVLQKIYGGRFRGLYLFGSHARGEAVDESDVDVAIVIDDIDTYWNEIERTSHLVAELALKYGVSLAPVMLREREWKEDDFPFYSNLRREGIRI